MNHFLREGIFESKKFLRWNLIWYNTMDKIDISTVIINTNILKERFELTSLFEMRHTIERFEDENFENTKIIFRASVIFVNVAKSFPCNFLSED